MYLVIVLSGEGEGGGFVRKPQGQDKNYYNFWKSIFIKISIHHI